MSRALPRRRRPRWSPAAALLAGALRLAAGETAARSPAEELATFQVPAGYAVQLVAAEPDIQKPLNLAFDARGRLWVGHTTDYPFMAESGAGGDGITLLAGIAADGRPASIARFASQLSIPVGVLPFGKGALITTHARFELLSDEDGDGKADRRTPILRSSVQVGDTHSMPGSFTRGFDGWVYVAQGDANTTTLTGDDGQQIVIPRHGGYTYRFRPDGSRAQTFHFGQVNPFGIWIDVRGDVFAADCHSKPVGLLTRGGYIASGFGLKVPTGLGGAPAIMTDGHGSTGIAGLVRYEAATLGEHLRDCFLFGNIITRRIHVDRATVSGSGWSLKREADLLVGDDPWFRPVALALGPDGALYIADFYNRIIGHREFPLKHPGRDRTRGRVWRVVPVDSAGRPRLDRIEDLTALPRPELARRLASGNATVRMLAMNHLVDAHAAEVPGLLAPVLADPSTAPTTRVHAAWAIERTAGLAGPALASLVTHQEALVRIHGLRILCERTALDASQEALVQAALRDADAFVQRAALMAAAAHPAPERAAALVAAATTGAQDAFTRYAWKLAVRALVGSEGGAAAARAAAAGDAAVLKAIDELAAGAPPAAATRATGAEALAALARSAPGEAAYDALAETAWNAAGGAATAAALLRHRQSAVATQEAALTALARTAIPSRDDAAIAALRDWAHAVAGQALESADGRRRLTGCDLVRTWRLAALAPRCLALAASADAPPAQRRMALTAAATADPAAAAPVLAARIADRAATLADVQQAAALLARQDRGEAIGALAAGLGRDAGRDRVLARALAASGGGMHALLDAIAAARCAADVLADREVAMLAGHIRTEPLRARLDAARARLPGPDAVMDALIAQRSAAFNRDLARWDAGRGRLVFIATCAPCHRTSEVDGGEIGPGLDGVGTRGIERLFEDILDPGRAVEAGFATVAVRTRDGMRHVVHRLRRDGQQSVGIAADGTEVRLPTTAIAEQQELGGTLMPTGFADLIAADDAHHLMAWLLTLDGTEAKTPGAASAKPAVTAAEVASLTGDARRGQVAFRAACSMCHRAEGQGQTLGPDLSAAGRRLDRAQIIAAILDPDAVIAEGFAAVEARPKAGPPVIGLPVEDGPDTLVLRLANGTTRRLPRTTLAMVQPYRRSLMPATVTRGMPAQRIADLVAYLLERKDDP